MATLLGRHVVVLGGAGFIGSHLCERLIVDGARVTAVDNLVTGAEANLRHLRGEPRFDLIRQDITLPIALPPPVDFVLNLASPASPIDYERLWLETMRVGSLGTQHALELAESHRAVFLQASTSEIYGDPTVHPQSEDYLGSVDCTGPRAVYDEAKRYGEALVQAFRRKRGLSSRIARIFNTYGPRMRLDDGRVVPAFLGQALSGGNFTVFGDGSQTRSFCYVEDLVDGLVRLMCADVNDPVNLGNPDERTILEFLDAVRTASGATGQVTFRALPPGDPKRRKPDIRRAQRLLGWTPQVSLADGLARTLAAFRSTTST